MTPGLNDLVEYQLAAQRLHDIPFTVATFFNREGSTIERWTGIRFYVNHVLHTYAGKTYEEVHHKAVRALMVYNRLDRIRGLT